MTFSECFFDVNHYLKNNEQDQKEKKCPTIHSRKIKGKKISDLNG